MSTKPKEFHDRASFLVAVSARFSALCSWCRMVMGCDYPTSERIIVRALQIRPGFIVGGSRPHLFDDTCRAAALDLAHEQSDAVCNNNDAAREAAREDVREIIG